MLNFYRSHPAVIEQVIRQAERTKLFRVRFEDEKRARSFSYRPGQFMQVGLPGVGEVPISMTSSPSRPGYIEFCIRAVGKVTDVIHNLGRGKDLWLRGPYGRPFPWREIEGRDLYFIAGGIGLAPLRSLINLVFDNRPLFGRVGILYGARSARQLCFRGEFRQWAKMPDTRVLMTVDRPGPGWKEDVGLVTRLWDKINPRRPAAAFAFVCGPPVMINGVALRLLGAGLRDNRIFVLLERHMKCGIGKCGHCDIGGKFVCVDGPVFSYRQIKELGYVSGPDD